MYKGVDPDSIPRYEIPEQVYADYEEEPERGACWNCDHMSEVKVGGKTYCLCVFERDMSASGDVFECDPEMRECKDWKDYEL